MRNDVGFSRPPQIPGYSPIPPRRTLRLAVTLIGAAAILGLVLAAALILRHQKLSSSQGGTGARLAHATSIPEFTAFKMLDDFVGVDCFYTSKFAEPLSVVGESNLLDLPPMSRVVVKKVVQESADFDHPGSKGYSLYLMTRDTLAAPANAAAPDQSDLPPLPVLHNMLLLYPTIGNSGEIIDLQLCPVASCQKARDLWLNKQFKFNGDKIGDIDPGTIVTVVDVEPVGLGTSGMRFDLSLRLPAGSTVSKSMCVDDLLQALQPINP